MEFSRFMNMPVASASCDDFFGRTKNSTAPAGVTVIPVSFKLSV